VDVRWAIDLKQSSVSKAHECGSGLFITLLSSQFVLLTMLKVALVAFEEMMLLLAQTSYVLLMARTRLYFRIARQQSAQHLRPRVCIDRSVYLKGEKGCMRPQTSDLSMAI